MLFRSAVSYAIYGLLAIFMSYLFYANITAAKTINALLSLVLLAFVLATAYLTHKKSYDNFAVIISSFIGSLTNTVLVLGGVYLMYGSMYMQKLNKAPSEAGNVLFGIVSAAWADGDSRRSTCGSRSSTVESWGPCSVRHPRVPRVALLSAKIGRAHV